MGYRCFRNIRLKKKIKIKKQTLPNTITLTSWSLKRVKQIESNKRIEKRTEQKEIEQKGSNKKKQKESNKKIEQKEIEQTENINNIV